MSKRKKTKAALPVAVETGKSPAATEIPATTEVKAEGIGRLDALLRRAPGARWQSVARIGIALLAVAIGWSFFARLDEVAVALGEIVPQGNVRTIQHLEGGIVRAIHVAEGDTVEAGAPLLLLGLGTAGLNADELELQVDALRLKEARLVAEADGTAPEFPRDAANKRPGILRDERAEYAARKRGHQSTLKVLRERELQSELTITELKSKKQALATELALANKSLAMSRDLLAQGLMAKLEHVQRQRDVARLRGKLATIRTTIPRGEAALGEARALLRRADLEFRREATEQLGQVRLTIARARESVAKAADQVSRTQIRSPIRGVVKNLRYHTIGGIVRAGEPIMEIVPTEEALVVEARLNPVDRGYVRVGQPATVKVTSYEYIRYGGLAGTVIQIAADANTDANGQPYFRVVIKTEKTYLGSAAAPLPISPGMQASVDIHTGSRTVMSYLIRPVLKLKHEAFRER